jgi:hypothetical protein
MLGRTQLFLLFQTPDIRSARYRYYICRLSVVLKAAAYTMYKRYLTKCVDSLKPPADGE